jgi:hypothetical protein
MALAPNVPPPSGLASLDTANIMNGITRQLSNGYPTILRPGPYVVTPDTLAINSDSVRLWGSGRGVSIVQAAGAGTAVLTLQGGALEPFLANLTIDAANLAQYPLYAADLGGRYLHCDWLQLKRGTVAGFANANRSFQMFWQSCILGGPNAADANDKGMILVGLCEGSGFNFVQLVNNTNGQLVIGDGVTRVSNLGFDCCQIAGTTANNAQDTIAVNLADSIAFHVLYAESNKPTSVTLRIKGAGTSHVAIDTLFDNGAGGPAVNGIVFDAGSQGSQLLLRNVWEGGYTAAPANYVLNNSGGAVQILGEALRFEPGNLIPFWLPGSSTVLRPAGVLAGTQWYDTTISKPIWYDGAAWRDAVGNLV